MTTPQEQNEEWFIPLEPNPRIAELEETIDRIRAGIRSQFSLNSIEDKYPSAINALAAKRRSDTEGK